MGKVYDFNKRKNEDDVVSKPTTDFKIFGEVSKIWGADFDKILFDNDETESRKLDRAVNKANLKFNTDRLNIDIEITAEKCEWCEGSGIDSEGLALGNPYACVDCRGTGFLHYEAGKELYKRLQNEEEDGL